MVQDVYDFEYIITSSEVEAFLLELNFIKKYRPKYNIMLMDDKTYPYLVISNEKNPRLFMTRDLSKEKHKKKGKYFGPYPNASACHDTAEVLNKIFPYRKCKELPKKACLYYQMGECLAPCIQKIESKKYEEMNQEVTKLLNGYSTSILDKLNDSMNEASENLNFEKALEYREIIKNLKVLIQPQKMILADGKSRDVFGFYQKDDLVCIQVLHIRYGRIVERKGEVFDVVNNLEDVVLSYIYNFYDSYENDLPSEVLLPYLEENHILSELVNTKFIVPIKGKKKQLVNLVCENAQNNLDNLQKMRLSHYQKTEKPLEDLSKLLKITYPKRIELFDNSNIQGDSSVSAMVCYIDGVRSPQDYRKYKVKTVDGADDFHTMQEVITRRYSRVEKENLIRPDLIIVDGGRPQVTAAKEALLKLGLTNYSIIGLEKDDNHRTKGIIEEDGNEIILDKKTELYLLLCAMQDEVHRFAITFFKKTHTKEGLQSILDGIEGIGKKRKQLLFANFETIDEIKTASKEKLHALGFPQKTIDALQSHFLAEQNKD
jgi:excinuclease ABC subunit C